MLRFAFRLLWQQNLDWAREKRNDRMGLGLYIPRDVYTTLS